MWTQVNDANLAAWTNINNTQNAIWTQVVTQ